MKKTLIITSIAMLVFFTVYEGCKRIQSPEKEFKAALDSLHKENDSLKLKISEETALIDSLEYVDSALTYQIEHQKAKIVKVTEFVDLSKKAVDTYSEKELVASFNKRYPQDTTTNPLPLAQPVLVSAAKDLIELDGVKQIIEIKDSVIGLQESRIATKDTIINVYASKEQSYIKLVDNKDLEISKWSEQNKKLQLENKKLKFKSKFQRIVTAAAIGGLTFILVSK